MPGKFSRMSDSSSSHRGGPIEAIRSLIASTGEFQRYLAASVVALGCDLGLLFALTQYGGVHYLTSATISYCAGAILHYVISIKLVFRDRSVTNRRLEFIGFFAVGLLGLGATQLVLKVAVDGFGLSYMIGKVIAIAVSFTLNFVVRKVMLFTLPRAVR